MPHAARKISESGYYHVVSKGVRDQLLFENDTDRSYYLELLDKAAVDTACNLHAYCLMSNHVHLVVEDRYKSLGQLMKFLDERYGMYFSEKTGRTGGIFQKPFWSEPIETDEHLLCTVRYVHANPPVAGICAASEYEWSSAKDYLGRKGIAFTQTVLDMCDGVDGFVLFSGEATGYAHAFPGSTLKGHLTDDEIAEVAKLTLGEDTLRNIGELPRLERNAAVHELRQSGLTLRQIVRVTGLGYRTVQSA